MTQIPTQTMTAEQIDATTWRVTITTAAGENGATTEIVHTVACRADHSSAEAAMATLVEVSQPAPEPDAAQLLAIEQAGMVCSRMQGILALGEDIWAQVLAYRDQVDVHGNPATAWVERVVIDDSSDWYRLSENMAFFGYLMGLSDAQMDDRFRLAMTIKA